MLECLDAESQQLLQACLEAGSPAWPGQPWAGPGRLARSTTHLSAAAQGASLHRHAFTAKHRKNSAVLLLPNPLSCLVRQRHSQYQVTQCTAGVTAAPPVLVLAQTCRHMSLQAAQSCSSTRLSTERWPLLSSRSYLRSQAHASASRLVHECMFTSLHILRLGLCQWQRRSDRCKASVTADLLIARCARQRV